MKVTNSGPGPLDGARQSGRAGSADAAEGAKDKRGSGKAGAASDGASEKVAISSRAKEVAKAMEAANSAPDVDEAKVARLKSAIKNGSYKVDADSVADRLVDEHLSALF